MKTTGKLEYLKFGEVRPSGWLLQQMNRDLAGFTGHLDELVPSLTSEDDIYGKNRLTRRVKSKDVGNIFRFSRLYVVTHRDYWLGSLWGASKSEAY